MSEGARALFQQFTGEGALKRLKDLKGIGHENYRLDFKTMKTNKKGNLADSDKKVYAIALSGFANSGGGVIVWGVLCKPAIGAGRDVVQEFFPIEKVADIKYDLHRLEPTMTDPAISGILHEIIIDPPGSKSGYIATFIPQIDGFPIMAIGEDTHRFYHRTSHSFTHMSHWMLASRFSKMPEPELILDWRIAGNLAGKRYIDVMICNSGRKIAKDVGVVLNLSKVQDFETSLGDSKDWFDRKLDNSLFEGSIKIGKMIHVNSFAPVLRLTYGIGNEPSGSIKYALSCDGFSSRGELIITSEEIKANKTKTALMMALD